MLKFEVSGFQFKDHQLRKQKFHISTTTVLSYQVNGAEPVISQGSNGFEIEWAIGQLFRSGQIVAGSDIKQINRNNQLVSITTESNGIQLDPVTLPPIKLTPYDLLALTASFQEKSILYKDTGTAHTAGIASTSELKMVSNDVYRMNAFDKVVGSVISNKSHSPILLISGKICDVTVAIAHQIGVQLIVSRSAPLWNACQLAEKNGQTLIGFARGPKFSIFGKNSHVFL